MDEMENWWLSNWHPYSEEAAETAKEQYKLDYPDDKPGEERPGTIRGWASRDRDETVYAFRVNEKLVHSWLGRYSDLPIMRKVAERIFGAGMAEGRKRAGVDND